MATRDKGRDAVAFNQNMDRQLLEDLDRYSKLNLFKNRSVAIEFLLREALKMGWKNPEFDAPAPRKGKKK